VSSDQPVEVGKIVGTHALKGALRVYCDAEPESALVPGRKVVLKAPDGAQRQAVINWSRPHKRVWLICLDGIDHIDKAEPLVGCEIFIDRADLPPLEEGTYYWQDLMGLSVTTVDGDFLGRIDSIIPTGANDVYVIAAGQGRKRREILIPAIASVVRVIDLDSRIIQVELPEGLADI
jgi:16S rRNA processing protein RimM